MVRRKSLHLFLVSLTVVAQVATAQTPPPRFGEPPGQPGRPGQPAPTPPPPSNPPSGPSQEDIERARRLGAEEGRAAGLAAGRPVGQQEGRDAGLREGQREGFDRCEREERQRAYDRGVREGYPEGERSGDYEGRQTGQREGESRGLSEGRQDGTSRADRDARNAATGPGRERGYQEANSSDASAVGQREGVAAGDRDARAEAERTDYPRGREAVRQERWNEPVAREDEFRQKNPVNQIASQIGDGLSVAALHLTAASVAAKDAQIKLQSRGFGSPQEQSAYDSAYREQYNRAYEGARREGYNETYRENYNRGIERGCADARNRDYRDSYRRGYEQGRSDGYRRAYDFAYRRAYDETYQRFFRDASNRAYSENYDGFYRRYFESARAEAYKERYGQLYQAAYQPAYRQKYDQVYPGYAQAAYQRGRTDETQDFASRPLRLLEAQATETIVNGVFEPGEALRIRLKTRSFAAGRIEGQRVKLVVIAEDAASAVVSEAQSSLVKAVEAKSLTTISEALEFRMNENQVGKSARFRLEVYVDGKLSDRKTFDVNTNFLAALSLAETPDLKEGLESQLRIRVRNQANVATDAGFALELLSQPDAIEVLGGAQNVGVLASGEERVISFRVIARASGASVDLPIQVVAKTGAGRRVGAYSSVSRVPLSNDYRIQLNSDLSVLRQAGVQRLEYQISNVSSQALMNGLQLGFSVLGPNSSNFAIVGPNPQYLAPMIRGQVATFVVPVLVKQGGFDGVLELNVQEDGRPVVIHRRKF